MAQRVDPSISARGAPLEPQRTRIRIGVAASTPGALVRLAASAGLLGQEALEPTFTSCGSGEAVGRLVTSELDVAIVDLATFLGERLLGWDGLAIAVFGPDPADRAVSVAIVEADTWRLRPDPCERFVRANARALARLREPMVEAATITDITGADVQGWWPDLRPSARELVALARWSGGRTPRVLRDGLAWAVT
jgi:hypothetical protein